jgi:hypothetical protein
MLLRPLVELSLGLCFWWIASVSAGAASEIDLRGVWRPESYILKDGSQYSIDGIVFFSDKEWTFLVFVTVDGEPLRGEGEGGTYAVNGDELVFTHLYILLAGKAVGSLPQTPLRMEIKDSAEAAKTPCRVTLEADRLTIRFGPSGNSMIFRRGSRL